MPQSLHQSGARSKIRGAVRTFRQEQQKIVASIQGTLKGNKISVYWFAGTVNFGDLISPELLRHYGFTPVLASIENAEVLSTGSVLQKAREGFSGHVLGSGLIRDTDRYFPKATIWAVRGELTRKGIHAPPDVVLGDPGILATKLVADRQAKKYTVGIVPHFVDSADPRIAQILERYRDDVQIIDVMRMPSVVISEIDQCQYILSSSLHGVVVADALGIPSAWITLSDKIIGDGFKFYDYFTAIRISQDPLQISGHESLAQLLDSCRPSPETVAEVAENLDATFRAFQQSQSS